MEQIKLTARDGLELAVTVLHAEEPKALVQIIHGAKEHKARYYHFAEFLQENGFTVILSDNRGHGESVNEDYPLGYMDGVQKVIEDQMIITRYIKDLYPDKDLYLFGHSLGSVFARCYLQAHDHEIKKLILSGTVNYVPAVSFGVMLGKIVTLFSGKHGYNRFIEGLSTKNQKDDSWISVSEFNLEKYRNDPLCQFKYQNRTVLTVFDGVRNLHQFDKYTCQNPDLPILNISGAGDPITGGEKGLRDSIQSLRKIGYSEINNIVYPNMNHEVLNEDDHEMVYKDVLEFFLSKSN